ncbi:MAG: DinB family protein [Bacteroidota bacterium]
MTEIQKIEQLFNELQQGECWIGLNMQQVLEGVTPEKAAAKFNPDGNSIWQLVNHISYWRKTVMIRLNGKDAYPSSEDFYIPPVQDTPSWKNTLADFNTVYLEFRNTIIAFDEAKLNQPSPKPGQTYYQLLMGCLQHDSYHMGQMVLLKKGDE